MKLILTFLITLLLLSPTLLASPDFTNKEDFGVIADIDYNAQPEIDESSISPSDDEIDVSIALDVELSINVSDAEGDSIEVRFYDGNDNLLGTDSCSGNRTATYTWEMLEYNHTYYWYVIAEECPHQGSYTNTSSTFSFSTLNPTPFTSKVNFTMKAEVKPSNYPPFSENEDPLDGELDVELDVGYWNVTIKDPDGDNTNGSIECSNGDSTSWNDLGNGTRSLELITSLNYGITYTIWLNYTDGNYDKNETFTFTTFAAAPPTLSNENPVNESVDILFHARDIICSIQVNDTLGYSMNVFFSTNASGSWNIYQTNSSVNNGTYEWVFPYENENTKYWWRVSANNSYHNTSELYHFTTKDYDSPILSNENPVNESTGVQTVGGDPGTNTHSVDISDPLGLEMDIYWSSNYSGSWVTYDSQSGHNDTYSWSHVISDFEANTTYWWRVIAKNEFKTSNETYHYTTVASEITVQWFNFTDPYYYDPDLIWEGYYGDEEYPNLEILIQSKMKGNDEVEYINISINDLTFGEEVLTADNIELYLGSDLGGDRGYLGTFESGGSNLTINSSNWNEDTMGPTPFPIDNRGVRDIFLNLSLEIPCDWREDITFSSSDFKIYPVTNRDYINKSYSFTGEVNALFNSEPIISSYSPANSSNLIVYDEEYTLSVDIEDPEGDEFFVILKGGYNPVLLETLYTSSVDGNRTITYDVELTQPCNTYYWYIEVYESPYVGCYYYNFSSQIQFDHMNAYNQSIRKGGVDYFLWQGNESVSAEEIRNLLSFSSSNNYIAIWNSSSWDSTNWLWELYRGDGSGSNFTVAKGDIIKTYITGGGSIDFTMFMGDCYSDRCENADVVKTSINKGYNYIGHWNDYDENLNDIDNNLGFGEVLAWWDTSEYEWKAYIVGITPYNILITGQPVFEVKVHAGRWVATCH
jgi:hypothetical protein